LERPGDFMTVFAHEHETEAEYNFALAVGGDGTAANFAADLHLGHIAHAYWRAVLGNDVNRLDVLDARRAAGSLDPNHLASTTDSGAADVEVVFLAQGLDDFVEREAMADQALGNDAHQVLLLIAAPAIDLGRSANGAQLRFDVPVVRRAQFSQVVAAASQ